jgi:predicted MFS family arabinose efflux permease
MLIASLIVLGTASGTVVVPILLELVQAIKDGLGVLPGANEKASALFTMSTAIGSILGNWLGGFFYQLVGNETTGDIFGMMSLIMGGLYFAMNIWPGLLLPKKK